MRRWYLLAIAVLFLPNAAIADPCPDELGTEESCVANSPWYRANLLTVHFESADGQADWRYELASGAEYRITLDERLGGPTVKGTIMVIDGRVMLTHGLNLDADNATDSLDAPALVQQLTLKLLQNVYPKGRDEVLGVEDFRVRREHLYLTAATSRASTEFAPPWSVTGTVDNGNFGWVDFDLTFEAPDVDYQARFSGRWEKRSDPVTFPDTTIIEDWQVWPLAPQPDPAPLKPGRTARDMRIITLGDLRRIMDGG